MFFPQALQAPHHWQLTDCGYPGLHWGGGRRTHTLNQMKTNTLAISAILALTILATGCGEGWKMDYGSPAAQFHAHDMAGKGEPFIGKKITVKGNVLRVDDQEDGNHVVLEHNIHCVFPSWHWGEEELKTGDEIFVDGILRECSKEKVLLDPALKRDSTASFRPK